MKTYVIFSSKEPLLVATRRTIRNREVLGQLRGIGCSKFIAREIPVEPVRRRYRREFEVIESALRKGSELRVLDSSGERVFRNVSFSDFGRAYRCDSGRSPS